MIGKLLTFLLTLLFFVFTLSAQTYYSNTSYKESPPPSININQKWWNLQHYEISVTPDYNKKTISGTNTMQFRALYYGQDIQIDLNEPMVITDVKWKNASIKFKRENSESYLITFPQELNSGMIEKITIHFEGKPSESVNPPYDNGWIWKKDKKDRPWISATCQGGGASVWLPSKNVMYDEPDSGVVFSITVSDTLKAVANGRLNNYKRNNNGTDTYTWKVVSPINHYNIIPYIGKYVSWHEEFPGLNKKLDCDFWVLDYNLEKAKKHFRQTDTMLRAFEYWMGPYPFYADGFKLVEAPQPGMEHQSAVAYGNGFQNGFNGKDLFGTGWGLKWDFILIHESGHEWFGNSITTNNHGDTWIHEGFTKYLETLYTDYVFGTDAGNEYAVGTWKRIKNDKPILGTSTSDKYYKGSAMLHMIRQIVGDSVFRAFLLGLNSEFYHQTIKTSDVLKYLNFVTQKDFTNVFDQYLKTIQLPTLEYYFKGKEFHYRWANCVDEFSMPVKVSVEKGKYNFISPTSNWKKLSVNSKNSDTIIVDRNFYIQSKNTRN